MDGGAAYAIWGIGDKRDMGYTLYLMGGDERFLLFEGGWYKVSSKEELPLPVDRAEMES